MDKDLDREQSILDKLTVFLKQKKKLVILITFLILAFTITVFIVYEKNKSKNIMISEKYVKAGILLSKKENKKAKTIYEEIILSNNKFYSLLALNVIIENKLIIDQKKILKYFLELENQNFSPDLKDLILFKKALYLLSIKDNEIANSILEDLIKNKSKLTTSAQEIIK